MGADGQPVAGQATYLPEGGSPHKRYLSKSKKKKASKASLRKALRYLLNCVERNLGHTDQMLDLLDGRAFPLPQKYQRLLWVIHTLYVQQRGVYEDDS